MPGLNVFFRTAQAARHPISMSAMRSLSTHLVSPQLKSFKYQTKRHGELTLFTHNEEGACQTLDDHFRDEQCRFEADTKSPFIIDAGANEGFFALFIKKLYPDAKLLCFEPDPNAFKAFQKNIAHHNLTHVACLPYALSNETGKARFYGYLSGEQPDARGNALNREWGNGRQHQTSVEVPTKKLSDYIEAKYPVDFLKMDIEGGEEKVMQDLDDSGSLAYVKHLDLEIHTFTSDSGERVNEPAPILNILKKFGFQCSIEERCLLGVLPDDVKAWEAKVKPTIAVVSARNLNLLPETKPEPSPCYGPR